MLRFPFLCLVLLIISVAGEENYNETISRLQLLPVPSQPHPIKLESQSFSSQPSMVAVPQPPIVNTTQLPPVAATEVVSIPQVIIQLVGGSQTPVITAPQTSLQPAVIPSVPSAVPAVQSPIRIVDPVPQVAALSSPLQSELFKVPVEPEEEPASYEPALETETEIEPELFPELESIPELEPILQPESELPDHALPDLTPQTIIETVAAPQTTISSKPSSHPLKLRPQLNFVPASDSVSKLVVVKPSPSVLPPLLPKPQPVRELIFGRHTVSMTQYPVTPVPVSQPPTQRVTTDPPTSKATLASQRSTESWKFDSVCKRGNRYYPVDNECDTYIECKYNKAVRRWCPDGLHFNPTAQRNEYPCTYPSAVQCNVGTEKQKPRATGPCPRKYGFFSSNDGDCTKYIVCQAGAATVMDCPVGLVFNPTTRNCDWIENVPQCNPNVFKDYVCPEPPIDTDGLESNSIHRYRYEGQCQLYIACYRGYPRLLSCEYGLSFDEDSQRCLEEEFVQGCATPR